MKISLRILLGIVILVVCLFSLNTVKAAEPNIDAIDFNIIINHELTKTTLVDLNKYSGAEGPFIDCPELAELIGDPSYTCKFGGSKGYGVIFNWVLDLGGVEIYKNGELIDTKEASIINRVYVSIPASVEKTDTAYADYAVPLIEKWLTENAPHYLTAEEIVVLGENHMVEGDDAYGVYVVDSSYSGEELEMSSWLTDIVLMQGEPVSTLFDTFEEDGVNYVRGLDIKGNKNTAANILSKSFGEYTASIYDKNGKELKDANLVGTGAVVKLVNKKDSNNVAEYKVIVYGDVTGDGKINAIDALDILKSANKLKTLSKEALLAGRTNKDKKAPTAVDALAILKHANNLKTIEQ